MVPAADRPTGDRSTKTAKGARKVITLSVRVFAKQGYVFAECLDLSLIARRDSPEAALRALYEQIQLYAADAHVSGDWDQAMHRSASWYRWVLYYRDWFVDLGSRMIRHESPDSVFIMPFDRTGRIVGASA